MREIPEADAPSRKPRSCRHFLRRMAEIAVPADATVPTLPVDLQRHLDGCAPCREEVRRDRTALATLRAAAQSAASELEESGNGALSPARRRLVLDRATARPGLGWGLVPVLDWRPALAVATAAVVMV